MQNLFRTRVSRTMDAQERGEDDDNTRERETEEATERRQAEMNQYGDDIIKDALIKSTCGLDLDVAEVTIGNLNKALQLQSERLKNADWSEEKLGEVGRTLAYTMKVVDGYVRVIQFAKGQPDSRPDLGGVWLKQLSDDQLTQVMQWLKQRDDGLAELGSGEEDSLALEPDAQRDRAP